MNKIRRVIFEILQELEGIEPIIETKNSNPLKEIKATMNICLTEMSEITNKTIGRWSKIQNAKISQYEKIAFRLAHKYVKFLEVPDKDEAFQELVAAGMEGIMHGLTSYTPGMNTKVSTFVFSRTQFAIQKQFATLKKDMERQISLNAKIDESNDETTDFQTIMASPTSIEEEVERKISHQILYKAMSDLSPDYKKIAVLCSEFSVGQVAKKINRPIKDVHAVLTHLRKKMSGHLTIS